MSSRWKTLGFKLPLIFLLCSLLPLAGFSLLAIHYSKNALVEFQARASNRTVLQAGVLIEKRLSDTFDDLVAAAENLDLHATNAGELKRKLSTILEQQPALLALTALDPHGGALISATSNPDVVPPGTADWAKHPAFLAAQGGRAYKGPAEHLKSGPHKIQISVPLLDPVEQNLTMVLVGEVTLQHLVSGVIDLRIGNQGQVYIMEKSGAVIAHPDFDVAPYEEDIVVTALAGESPVSEETISKRYVNPEGVEVLGVARPVKGTDWLVVAELPVSELEAPEQQMRQVLWGILLTVLVLSLLLSLWFLRRIIRPLKRLERGAVDIGAGRFSEKIQVTTDDEVGRVSEAYNQMADRLQAFQDETHRTNWLKSGLSGLDSELRGTPPLAEMTKKAITYVAGQVNAPIGALYVKQQGDRLALSAGHALQATASTPTSFAVGEGLVGQTAYERQVKTIEDVPAHYLNVASSLGATSPQSILLLPLIHNGEVVGVIELGAFAPFSGLQKAFLEQAATPIAIAVNAALTRLSLEEALRGSQLLAEELQSQQEELRVANEELEEQTQHLKTSEEQLKSQQEELQAANEELEEKTLSLEERQRQLAEKNDELLIAKHRLEQKAHELEIASKYKSEFLANMSHELRTPLNSLLILSQDLAANKHGRLGETEVESARLIYSSGHDLLRLINEILDLAKIEAGKMDFAINPVPLAEVADRLLRNFRHMAEAKGLKLSLDLDPGLPATIRTDAQRLDQILKNLLSNAIKFTESGSISIKISSPAKEMHFGREGLGPDNTVAIAVTDTGIGIPRDKLEEIFHAFQQVDGSISRKYGGTGLGLSISKELALLLGGEIQVESQLGIGSTFTLYLPVLYERRAKSPEPAQAPSPVLTVMEQQPLTNNHPAPSIQDDREILASGEKTILIIEDDLVFAQILAELCHEKGFKFLHAGDGKAALKLIEKYSPSAVFLDIRLPGMHGLELLDVLKGNRDFRHLPVHVISVEERGEEAFQRGAIGFLNKPTTRQELVRALEKIEECVSDRIRTLLIVEDDPAQQKSIAHLIGNGDVKSVFASTGQKALEILRSGKIDCMILDLKLPDVTGFELLNQMDALEDVPVPPVIIYTAGELSRDEELKLQQYASSIIIKGAHSPERLLDEASLFLHRVVSRLPTRQQQMIDSLHSDPLFAGKKILLVDDDMRNVFALAKVLEDRGMQVFKAANGEKALEQLAQEPDIDLVLMDIMMPVMDGYEAMQAIRKQARFQKLPILALTAKAMREDRKKCIEAGANDYLAKPVDIKRLCSMIRVWLYR